MPIPHRRVALLVTTLLIVMLGLQPYSTMARTVDRQNDQRLAQDVTCDPHADLSAWFVTNSKGAIYNKSETCSYDVGMASYEKYDEVIDHQKYFDSDTATVGPKEKIYLNVGLPNCAAQIDLFYGPVLQSLDGQRYGSRLLSARHVGGTNYCGTYPTETPTETVTETPTATETETATPTATETATPTATETETATPTATETETATPTATETETATPTNTETATPTGTPVGENCTYTIGYWKNHPNDWPVMSLTIGGVLYDQDALMDILNSTSNDMTYLLAKQLVAALLNIANGADDSAVADTIDAAQAWLVAHPLGSNPQGDDRTEGEAYKDILDDFNNGVIGPGHCGDVTPTPTSTATETPTSTATETPTSTATETPTSTATETPTSTATETPTGTPVGENCTYTIGYWKNHPNDWPVMSLTIGGVTYNQTQLLNILDDKTPDGAPASPSDATYNLAKQLIGAMLNVANGADDSSVADTITDANQWLMDNPLGSNPKGATRDEGLGYKTILDEYNNGLIGPGHCGNKVQPVWSGDSFVQIVQAELMAQKSKVSTSNKGAMKRGHCNRHARAMWSGKNFVQHVTTAMAAFKN